MSVEVVIFNVIIALVIIYIGIGYLHFFTSLSIFPVVSAFIYLYIDRSPGRINLIIMFNLLLLVFILYLWLNAELYPVQCMDGLTNAEREAWMNKSVVITNKIAYYEEQVKICETIVQDINANKANMSEEDFTREIVEANQALKETQTNLNSEVRMRNLLSNRLANGLSMESSDTPSSSKRTFDSDSAPYSKKRRFEDEE